MAATYAYNNYWGNNYTSEYGTLVPKEVGIMGYFKTSIPEKNGIFEIPLYMLKYFEYQFLKGNINSKDVAVSPIYKWYDKRLSKVRFDSAIEEIGNSTILAEYKSPSKKDTYYISRGLIFNENFEPLLEYSMLSEIYLKEDTLVLRYIAPIAKVSPKVFLNKKKYLESKLIYNIIPKIEQGPIISIDTFYIENTENYFSSTGFLCNRSIISKSYEKLKLCIENITDITINSFIDNNPQDILLQNLGDLKERICDPFKY